MRRRVAPPNSPRPRRRPRRPLSHLPSRLRIPPRHPVSQHTHRCRVSRQSRLDNRGGVVRGSDGVGIDFNPRPPDTPVGRGIGDTQARGDDSCWANACHPGHLGQIEGGVGGGGGRGGNEKQEGGRRAAGEEEGSESRADCPCSSHGAPPLSPRKLPLLPLRPAGGRPGLPSLRGPSSPPQHFPPTCPPTTRRPAGRTGGQGRRCPTLPPPRPNPTVGRGLPHLSFFSRPPRLPRHRPRSPTTTSSRADRWQRPSRVAPAGPRAARGRGGRGVPWPAGRRGAPSTCRWRRGARGERQRQPRRWEAGPPRRGRTRPRRPRRKGRRQQRGAPSPRARPSLRRPRRRRLPLASQQLSGLQSTGWGRRQRA